ncbi:gluconolaconase [Oceanicola sp. 22II-s10i]|uniref:SMP-30/gluconolactonase/LRE family protein n=1 Tax=Oceanicola sp. 22II-s10i TaxID=1317116 RepID=UPI000B51FAE5|nr:SMP-30/gluconolactonase/LRE family protein [Oceanicola sp. 22II-s10i]OWU85697.1 gluconolaconase [Oceanicola sp. 22II-s10i]
MKFTKVCDGLEFPEGPIAMDDGSIVLVEIKRQTLTRVTPDGKKEVIAELGGGPNGAAIGPDGACYVCNNGGFNWRTDGGHTRPTGMADDYVTGSIQRVDLSSGKFETLYTESDGRPLRGPNDIVFDKAGGFYFTDLGKSNSEMMHHGAFHYAQPDGSSCHRVFGPLVTPNGIGLSPGDTEVYVAETRTSRIWAFEVTGPGKVKPPVAPRPGRLVTTLPDFQLLDSLAIQENGHIAQATLVRGGINIVDPITGAAEFVECPSDPSITNICFGGADMMDAWICASATGALYHARWPYPGLRLHFNA